MLPFCRVMKNSIKYDFKKLCGIDIIDIDSCFKAFVQNFRLNCGQLHNCKNDLCITTPIGNYFLMIFYTINLSQVFCFYHETKPFFVAFHTMASLSVYYDFV